MWDVSPQLQYHSPRTLNVFAPTAAIPALYLAYLFAIDVPAAPAGFAARFVSPSPTGFGWNKRALRGTNRPVHTQSDARLHASKISSHAKGQERREDEEADKKDERKLMAGHAATGITTIRRVHLARYLARFGGFVRKGASAVRSSNARESPFETPKGQLNCPAKGSTHH